LTASALNSGVYRCPFFIVALPLGILPSGSVRCHQATSRGLKKSQDDNLVSEDEKGIKLLSLMPCRLFGCGDRI
jgi:hypothetical protein